MTTDNKIDLIELLNTIQEVIKLYEKDKGETLFSNNPWKYSERFFGGQFPEIGDALMYENDDIDRCQVLMCFANLILVYVYRGTDAGKYMLLPFNCNIEE